MRPSHRPTLAILGFLLVFLAIVPHLTGGRKLRADDLQKALQEKDLADSEKQGQPDAEPEKSTSRFNLALKTGGGTQLWTDHRNRNGFRIQQNALTKHWRCLDPNDVRQGWGTEADCEKLLDSLQPKPATVTEQKHFVILLHGLMRTHHSMKPVGAALRQSGYPNIIRFSYASTRSSIADHSAALRELMEDLPSNSTFSFVGHSMGNIVVRHLIGQLQDDDSQQLLNRCCSMVMLGPPNQGAAISRRLAPTGLYGWITGQGGLELGPQWETFVEELATPPFPFLIIAGDVSNLSVPLKNPLIDGSSDFVVGVDEARLEGAESLETVPVLHSFLMNDPASIEMTVDFIEKHSPDKPSEPQTDPTAK